MAADWIKMRGNLWDDPRVARLCDLTDSGEAHVIGGLYWLWATADQHSEDGVMPGLTLRAIDRKTGIQGFGDALVQIGWLADHPEGVRIARFEEHNGASAKRRGMDAQRKANVRNVSASDADKARTDNGQNAPNRGAREREEKEIEKEVKTENKAPAARVPALSAQDLQEQGVDEQTANEFLAVRKRKKAPLTELALAGIRKEADKAGWALDDVLKKCISRGWQSFEAEWVQPRASPGVNGTHLNRQEALEASNQAIAERALRNSL